MVTDELLKEFKGRMNITFGAKDDDLKKLLSYSISYVKSKCGDFDIEGTEEFDKRAIELVLERTRYAFNDAVEYFEDNFLSEILSLSIEMAGEENEGV